MIQDDEFKKYADRHLDGHIDGLAGKDQYEARQVRHSHRDKGPELPQSNTKSGRPWLLLSILSVGLVIALLLVWLLPRPGVDSPDRSLAAGAEVKTFSALAGPVDLTDQELGPFYNKHWPYGPLGAERTVCRETYCMGFPNRGRIARFVAFEVNRGKVTWGARNDPDGLDGYNHKIEGYVKGTLVPGRLVGGGNQAETELAYHSLNSPMTRELSRSWQSLDRLAEDAKHMLVGPMLNEPLTLVAGVVLPKRYFVILVGQERRAYWLYNDQGRMVETTPEDVEAETGMIFFDRLITNKKSLD